MRVGIYGGSFNPVHNGHLAAARGARAALRLDRVIFVPSGNPPLKGTTGLASGRHRLGALRAAIGDQPEFEISTIELERAGPSFTLDTVRTLRADLDEKDELFFLLGSDCLDRLPMWKGIDELHDLLRFAILPRPGWPMEAIDPRLILLDLDLPDISSTKIRDSADYIGTLVPCAVADYLSRHNLYSAPRAAQ